MKILFIIYSQGKASGGHYHSCDQISRALSLTMKVKIISIGSSISPILSMNPNFLNHIKYSNYKDMVRLNKALKLIERAEKFDLIHFFDNESMNVILPLPVFWKKKIVLTKCGGPNPKRNNWQYANGIINFSLENYNWFAKNKLYKKVDLFIIPNRVNELRLLQSAERIELKDSEIFNFVRISRIGKAYEKTLMDTFNLIEILKDNYKVKLTVIGRIQDEKKFDEYNKNAISRELPIEFIVDERASKASDFLYLADCVVGTGRSFMEATSLGIPVLTPVQNSNVPVFVNRENFNVFFSTNFSERNIADAISIKNNYNSIVNLISNKSVYSIAKKDTHCLFLENFSLTKITPKYVEVYQKSLRNEMGKFKLVKKNILYIIRTFLKH